MKRQKAFSILTNTALAVVVLLIGTICFFPAASPASSTSEKAIYSGNSSDGVSLMFNVYWGTDLVNGIMDVLDEYNVKATFFIGGSWADDNVTTLKAIAARGHELGSHGYFHRDHNTLSLSQNREEIKTSLDFIREATGVTVTLFAPPSGAYSTDTLTAASELGCKTVLWSKDTIDWRDKDIDTCLRRATQDVKGGDLILMHPMEHTLAALPQILEYYAANSLRVITVGENLSSQ